MGLTTVAPVVATTDTTTTAAVPDKTIAIQAYSSANTLMYTVPDNRTFTGYIYPYGTNNNPMGIVAAGGTFNNSTTTESSTQTWWPAASGVNTMTNDIVTLHAGDRVYTTQTGSIRCRILGVESDA